MVTSDKWQGLEHQASQLMADSGVKVAKRSGSLTLQQPSEGEDESIPH